MKIRHPLFVALVLSGPSQAHESVSLAELLAGWGTPSLDAVEVSSTPLAPGLFMLTGAGGNVAVSIGEQGVLMVDSQFPEMVPKLQAEIRRLGGGAIDFTVNTHWHFDHADGNPLLGRENSWIIAQGNSRRMMTRANTLFYSTVNYEQPPYPAEGLPVISFTDSMQLHFNGSRIDIMHFGPAHTTGDAVVIFRDQNVVHMGDVLSAGYPFIDAENGGDIDGMIEFCRAVLGEIDADTKLIPGHGPLTGQAGLAGYVAVLQTVRDRVSRLVADGKTLKDVIAARPTADFDRQYGMPELFLTKIYYNLTQ